MPAVKGKVNLAALQRKHASLLREVSKVNELALKEAGEYAKDHIKNKSKFERRSTAGHSVKDATKYRVVRTSTGKILWLENTKTVEGGYDVSRGLEYGTKAHTIVPRHASVLRFEVGGTVVFARRVRHPGTKAYKFMFKAVNAAYRYSYPRLRQRLAAAGRKF